MHDDTQDQNDTQPPAEEDIATPPPEEEPGSQADNLGDELDGAFDPGQWEDE